MLSVVIPALNAAATLAATLRSIAGVGEVVVVDGGSRDSTVAVARDGGARVITAPRGRGLQIAAGVAAAQGEWLLLLHADTVLGSGWLTLANDFMASHVEGGAYFRFALDTTVLQARRLERQVAWRCRVLGLPYGDQGLLVTRSLLDSVGGVRPLPIMEDVDLVRRIGRARLHLLAADAVTSAVRWERDGWRRRSARNLLCLALWHAGLPPSVLARIYR